MEKEKMKFITADNLKRFGTNVKKLVTDTKSGLETKIGTAQSTANTAKQAAATAQGAATDAKNNPNVKTINGKSIVGSGNLTLNDIGIDGNIVEIVTSLPDLATAKSNKMYLVPVENSSEANNTYAEYVKINKEGKDSWEKLGEWKAEITVDSTLSDSTNPIQNKAVNTAVNGLKTRLSTAETNIGNKVDKVTGKQLSTNDYTTAEKNKLAGIAEGANKTVVDTTFSTTSTNPVENRVIKTALNELTTNIETALNGKASTDVVTNTKNGLFSSSDYIDFKGTLKSLESNVDDSQIDIIGSSVDGTDNKFITLPSATTAKAGLLSSTDKAKLNNLDANASSTYATKNDVSNTYLAKSEISALSDDDIDALWNGATA